MTMRDRILAVIQGREVDRVPFVQYSGLAAPDREVWDALGRDEMGIILWSSVHRIDHPHCRFEDVPFERNGRRGERTILHTPAGDLVEEKVFEPTYGTAARRKHFISEPSDYPIFMAYLRDLVVSEDVDNYLRHDRAAGDDGLPMVAVVRTPYQQMWVQWVCLTDFALHLVDYPDMVGDTLDLLADIERRIFRVVRRALDVVPIPFVDFPDNITAPPIGRANFRRWCVPFYDELADMLAEKNVPVFVHMDGDLKPLAQDIAASKVRGLDSFSPQPDNDTSPAEAAAQWPEKRLFVNFPSSVHIAEPDAIYAQASRILAEAGHTGRLEIQVSENVPPGRWRTSFPQIVRAIHDFGRP